MDIQRVSGRAADVVRPALPAPLLAAARTVELDAPALILGSGQVAELVDPDAATAAGVDVVRRHSGGGAVLLAPGRFLWIDVYLPQTDRRWDDDVAVSFHWLGDAWASALHHLGVPATVYRDRLERTPWGGLVCFGALGPGEVSVGGRKVVGMSQRRARAGARFQCLVHDQWRPHDLLALLRLTPRQRQDAATDLAPRAAGAGVPLGALVEVFLERLGRMTE